VKLLPPIVWLTFLSIPLLTLAYLPIKYKNVNKSLFFNKIKRAQ